MRQALTKKLADSISLSYQQAEDEWWFSKTKTGLRLSDDGFHTLVTKCDIEYYVWKPDEAIMITPKILLGLDRKIEHPYYLQLGKTTLNRKSFVHAIVLFGEKQALLLTLIGDLEQWLDRL